jgi:hypothetical protein
MIPFLSIICCDLCLCIPRILAADANTGAIVVAAAIIVEDVFFVVVPTLIFLSFNFSRYTVLSSHDYKHGDKFQRWIPKLKFVGLFQCSGSDKN